MRERAPTWYLWSSGITSSRCVFRVLSRDASSFRIFNVFHFYAITRAISVIANERADLKASNRSIRAGE